MVSIIIPAYNAERWLGRAIDSALGQTCRDVEIVVVNDGSTDGTLQLAKGYDDPRISVFSIANGGQANARNVAIGKAKGEWMTFLDADDLLAPRAVELMLAAAVESGAEMVEGRMQRGGRPGFDDDPFRYRVMDSTRGLCNMLYQRGLLNSACGKLFARELFEHELFTKGIYYEDLDFTARVYRHVNRVAWLDNMVYYYRDTEGSFINTFHARRLDVLKVTEGIERMYPHGPLGAAARDRRMAANFNMLALLEKYTPGQNEELKRQCWEVIRQRRLGSLLNPHVRFKNKAGVLASYLGRGFFKMLAHKFAGR